MQAWARIVVLFLSVTEISTISLVAVLREKLGWTSNAGQFLWVLLGLPTVVGVWLVQQVLYWTVASHSPFDDVAASAIMSSGSIGALVVIFYYVYKHSSHNRTRK
jgi:hypothetical protein